MPYKINGTDITLQPTTGKWVDRREMGISGDGHAVYPSLREFELKWELISAADLNQLNTFFASIGVTGSAVVELPKWAAPTWTFYAYSGCILREPEVSEYFEEHTTSVKMLVVRIQT